MISFTPFCVFEPNCMIVLNVGCPFTFFFQTRSSVVQTVWQECLKFLAKEIHSGLEGTFWQILNKIINQCGRTVKTFMLRYTQVRGLKVNSIQGFINIFF